MRREFMARLAFPLVVALIAAVVVAAGAAFCLDQPRRAAVRRHLGRALRSDTRDFRGHANVDAHIVNAALVAQLNTISGRALPADGGLNAVA